MTILTLYQNKKGAVSTIMPDGTRVSFIKGQFYTENKAIAEFLDDCIKTKTCGVFIDPDNAEIDTEKQTPRDIMRAELRAELLKEQRLGLNKVAHTDPGNSRQPNFNESVVNTTETASVAGVTPEPGAGGGEDVPQVTVDGSGDGAPSVSATGNIATALANALENKD